MQKWLCACDARTRRVQEEIWPCSCCRSLGTVYPVGSNEWCDHPAKPALNVDVKVLLDSKIYSEL